MAHTCLYCNSPFVGARRTKMYCDDACRQQAYLLRKRNVEGVIENKPATIKPRFSIKPGVKELLYDISVKNDTVKVNTVNPQASEQTGLEGTRPLKKMAERIEALESALMQQNNLLLTMWTNIKAGLESTQLNVINELRKEFSKNNPFWRGLNGIEYCQPCSVNDFTLISVVKESVVSVNQSTENEILKQAQEKIKELQARLKDQHRHASPLKEEEPVSIIEKQEKAENNATAKEERLELEGIERKETKVIPLQSEQPYQWINPKLHILIQRQLDKGDGGQMFRSALSSWPLEQAKHVLWVNIRLRCLLDNLIRLSLRSHTNYDTFAALTNAFIDLSASEPYRELPLDYPYVNMIAEQTDILRRMVMKSNPRKEKFHTWISTKRKATIVAACTELAQSTEKISFSDLDFEPVKLNRSFIEEAKTFQSKKRINTNK